MSRHRNKPSGATPAPSSTVAQALHFLQGQRHKGALLTAAAGYLESNFLSGDLGPPRFRISGGGTVEVPRADIVQELAGELRQRALDEQAKALAVLAVALADAEQQVPTPNATVDQPEIDATAVPNPERGTRRWEGPE